MESLPDTDLNDKGGDFGAILRLNQAGRRYLIEDGSSVSKGVSVLSAVSIVIATACSCTCWRTRGCATGTPWRLLVIVPNNEVGWRMRQTVRESESKVRHSRRVKNLADDGHDDSR
jgi:hypothetical protein